VTCGSVLYQPMSAGTVCDRVFAFLAEHTFS
jgi:hypothetical protein